MARYLRTDNSKHSLILFSWLKSRSVFVLFYSSLLINNVQLYVKKTRNELPKLIARTENKTVVLEWRSFMYILGINCYTYFRGYLILYFLVVVVDFYSKYDIIWYVYESIYYIILYTYARTENKTVYPWITKFCVFLSK